LNHRNSVDQLGWRTSAIFLFISFTWHVYTIRHQYVILNYKTLIFLKFILTKYIVYLLFRINNITKHYHYMLLMKCIFLYENLLAASNTSITNIVNGVTFIYSN
jgi:hypothetical protein